MSTEYNQKPRQQLLQLFPLLLLLLMSRHSYYLEIDTGTAPGTGVLLYDTGGLQTRTAAWTGVGGWVVIGDARVVGCGLFMFVWLAHGGSAPPPVLFQNSPSTRARHSPYKNLARVTF